MQLTIGWIQLAAAAGALQGVLLTSALVSHKTNRTANRLLAALMAAFTIYLVWAVYYMTGLVPVYPHLFGISYPLLWLFGPLVYLYAVTASDGSRTLHARDALHFLPALSIVVAFSGIYMMSATDKIALWNQYRVGHPPTVLAVIGPTKYLSGLAYSAATIAFVRRHGRRIQNSYSNVDRVNLQWLLWFAGSAGGIWLLAAAISLVNLIPSTIQRYNDNLVVLAVALLVYAIGYRGLRQPEIHRYDEATASSPDATAEAQATPSAAERAEARYERSGLGAREAAALKAELLSLMGREHPYRDPDLTLSDLASQLNTTPHKLSEVLNTELAQTFYDFVNGYRVEDVRRRLTDDRSKHLNVLALAMDAGFASKSTFNQVFKARTGHTPSMYRKALAG